MPCYSATNVDQQRGNGVFDRSIKGLQALNAVGYGQPGSGLQLDLVYNPNGIFLAPAQSKLEVGSAVSCGVCTGVNAAQYSQYAELPDHVMCIDE